MKKLFLFVLLIICLAIANLALAAGTVTTTISRATNDTVKIVFAWTADASDGSVPATATTQTIDGYVVLVITNPGGTAPTDNYDITLTDADSVDIMGGTLADRDTSNSEHAVPKIGAVYGGRWVSGTITLNITNNSVNSATGTVTIYVQK